MKNFKILGTSILAVQLALVSNAFATRVFVAPASGSGVSAGDLVTAHDLVQTSVSDVSSDSIVDQESQSDLTLSPKLMRLGESYVLSLSKIHNGEVLFSSQLKAGRIEELDKVAENLTRSVLQGNRAKDDLQVGEITNQEAHDGTQRRPVRKETYLGFGGSHFGNLNSTGTGYSIGLGYGWDLNRELLKILGEADINGSAFFATAAIGLNYFFTLTDIAPYVSGDFGLGIAKIDNGSVFSGQTVGGFALGYGAGIEFFRTSSVNLDLGFHEGFILHQNNYGTPHAISFRVGLHF